MGEGATAPGGQSGSGGARVGPSRVAIRFERETETEGHEVEVEIRGILTKS